MTDIKRPKLRSNCDGCNNWSENYFCNFSETNRRMFQSLQATNHYAKGEYLFIEGQPAKGIYMLCIGRVKLSTCSREGKVVIMHIAEAGEVLGLSSSISDSVHITTAEALEPCRVNFVGNSDFRHFLESDARAGLSAIKQLSRSYDLACLQICSLGLSATVADKLATLFLNWCKMHGVADDGKIYLKFSYTHEEIAQMIGSSRETVTRLLKNFQNRRLILRNGSEIIIPDAKKLEAVIGTRADLNARATSASAKGNADGK